MNQLACLCTEVNLQKIYHVPTRVGVANVRAKFEIDMRGDDAAAFARVRASTRGRSKSSTELANLGSNSPIRRNFSYDNDRTAHSVRIFGGTYSTSAQKKLVVTLLVRKTCTVLRPLSPELA